MHIIHYLKTTSLVILATASVSASCRDTDTGSALDHGPDINRIEISAIGKSERITFGGSRKADPETVYETQQQRGVIPTGLTALFDQTVHCRAVDNETWARDYSHKRGKPAHHKGIDIPAPRGTPVLAVANGTVVGKYLNENNAKGIEIVLRHTPADTGLPMWTYSQYTHLMEMPAPPLGTRVRMGSELGKTGNSGISGREAKRRNSGDTGKHSGGINVRRDALHFAIFYSASPRYAEGKMGIIPLEGYFMDPHAFYRKQAPYDSAAMKNLPLPEKQIPIPFAREDGQWVPGDTRVIWPYACAAR